MSRNRFMDTPTEWRYFWIDAICIDQSSVAERNHQVAIMDSIFMNAAFALVWLGKEADGSQRAVQSMANHPRSTGWLSCDHCEGPNEEPISQFIARPYWSRVWVIQEFLLARAVLLFCGSERLRWSELIDWLDAHDGDLPPQFAIAGDDFGKLVRRRATIIEMEDRRLRLAGLAFTPSIRDLSLRSVLDKFWGRDCTDRRDKVYGLLSLATTNIKPDYAKTVNELYVDVLKTEQRAFLGEEWEWRSFKLNLQLALGIDTQTAEQLESPAVRSTTSAWPKESPTSMSSIKG